MLSDGLRRAYQETDYHVFARKPFVLRPGVPAPEADALLRDLGHTVGVVLTAWNPISLPTDAAANAAAQERLVAELGRLGLNSLPAEGRGHDQTWTPEPSLFIPGVMPETAQELAVQFRQAAWVEVAIGAPVRIMVTDFGAAPA